MTRAWTRILRHVWSRNASLVEFYEGEKHVLAVEETCLVVLSLQSRRTPRSRITSDGGIQTALWVNIEIEIINQFRVSVLVWYSLIGQAPAYLIDLCRPSLSARSTRHLRSAEQGLLHVPFARTSIMQSRAFSVVGPLVWNGLPLALRSLLRVFSQKFLQQLKTTLFGRAGVGSASE